MGYIEIEAAAKQAKTQTELCKVVINKQVRKDRKKNMNYAIEQRMARIASFGYGIFSIDGGKLEVNAKFAIADSSDNEEGFYLEAATVEEIVAEVEADLLAVPIYEHYILPEEVDRACIRAGL